MSQIKLPVAYQDALDLVMETLEYKGDHYKKQPLDYMDVDDLLPIVRLKVERAIQVKHHEKKIDEIKDIVCYSMKLLQRVLDEGTNQPIVITEGDTQ